MLLPPPFLDEMQQLVGGKLSAFLRSLEEEVPVSIRINPRKRSEISAKAMPVLWSPEGYYLSERPIFTLDPLFHGGAYYVQEAASMFLSYAIRQLIDRKASLKILDLCAAPGGKSTILASLISDESLLVANEVIRSRYKVLRENLTRWGYSNIATTCLDSTAFQSLSGFFDLVVVDAPCSGEGLFRKDPNAVREWSPDNVKLCAARQKRILAQAVKVIRPGGHLFYATCTYNRQENDDNARWLSETLELHHMPLEIPEGWRVEQRARGVQFYPHRTKGEGFFLACFQKPLRASGTQRPPRRVGFKRYSLLSKGEHNALDKWIDPTLEVTCLRKNNTPDILAVPNTLVPYLESMDAVGIPFEPGTKIGIFKKADFVPAHSLALSFLLHPEVPVIAFDKAQALTYLKKEIPAMVPTFQGWAVATYQGIPLGWIKGLKNRMNNYFPKAWRIRMKI